MTSKRAVFYLTITSSALLFSCQAAAFCAEGHGAGSLNRFTSGQVKHGSPIPVYVVGSGKDSIGPNGSKTNYPNALGFSKTQVIRVIRAVVQRFGESSANIRPYYAGEVATGEVREGIVIRVPDAAITGGANEATTVVSPGVHGSLVSLSPTANWTLNPWTAGLGGPSLTSALTHEFSHSFGLNHLHEPCGATHYTDDPGHCSYSGCSSDRRSAVSLASDYSTADDIRGLRWRFGARLESVEVRTADPVAGGWGTHLHTVQTRTPPDLSGDAWQGFLGSYNAIAYTNAADRLRVSVDAGAGYGSPIIVGGGLLAPITYYRPAVAVGGGTLVVSWVHEVASDPSSLSVRYTALDIASGTWSPIKTITNEEFEPHLYETELAFDTDSNQFLVAAREKYYAMGRVGILDLASGHVSGQAYMDGTPVQPNPLRSVGSLSCEWYLPDSAIRCVLMGTRTTTQTTYFLGGTNGTTYYTHTGKHSPTNTYNYGLPSTTVGDDFLLLSYRSEPIWTATMVLNVYGGMPMSTVQELTQWPVAVGSAMKWSHCGFFWCSSVHFRYAKAPW